jgi:tRNA G46 methylase TrmB
MILQAKPHKYFDANRSCLQMLNDTNTVDGDSYCNDIWNIDFDVEELHLDNTNQNKDDDEQDTADQNTGIGGVSNCITTNNITNTDAQKYTSKKPLWWRRQSGRKISKRQRQAIQEIQQLGYQLHLSTRNVQGNLDDLPPPHQNSERQIVQWDFVFPTLCRTKIDSLSTSDAPFHDRTTAFDRNNVVLPDDEIWLELGFGLGDNLLCLASNQKYGKLDVNSTGNDNDACDRGRKRFLVGAEIHSGGIGTLCTRIQSAIQNQSYWTDYTLFRGDRVLPESIHNSVNIEASNGTKTLYDNVRIYMGDGTKLLPHIPSGSVSVVLITFPDPFMGTNQSSYRLLQIDVLLQIRRILISPTPKTTFNENNSSSICGGGRLYLATDHIGYHQWSHEQVEIFNGMQSQTQLKISAACSNRCLQTKVTAETFRLIQPTPDRSLWLPVISKYERKGWDEGRQTYLSCWEAISGSY